MNIIVLFLVYLVISLIVLAACTLSQVVVIYTSTDKFWGELITVLSAIILGLVWCSFLWNWFKLKRSK